MRRLINPRTSVALVIISTLLGALNGLLAQLTGVMFTGNESRSLLLYTQVPSLLGICSLACLKFPKSGYICFSTVLLASLFLCVAPQNHHGEFVARLAGCASNLRFALVAEVLLLFNVLKVMFWARHS